MSQDEPRTRAEVRRSRWPGWIWAVPIAAAGILTWLGVRTIAKGGVDVTVVFSDAAQIQPNAKVVYRGVQVGEVEKVTLAKDGGRVTIRLRLRDRFKPFLRQGTRFWLIGAHPDFGNPATLKAIVAGPLIGVQPGGGPAARNFEGLEAPPPAVATPDPGTARFQLDFTGDAGGLNAGAPVELRGFHVGKVLEARLVYDAAAGKFLTPVSVELDPRLMGLPGGRASNTQARMDGLVTEWIGRGLQARVVHQPPVIGSTAVELVFAPAGKSAAGAGAAQGDPPAGGAYPAIPTAPSADVAELTRRADEVISRLDAVAAKAEALPLAQIGENVRVATARLRALAGSPKLDDSIDHLDRSLAEVDRVVHSAGPKIGPTAAALRKAADDAQATAQSARQLVAGSPTSQDSDIPSAIHELTEAARAIRSLADEIDRHPEALIKGRKGTKK